jgi:hypothetical protein
MTREEQIEFVEGLTDSIKRSIINKIILGNVPENWDGIELRWYLAERFNQATFQQSKKRKRDYNSTFYTNNL